MADIKKLKPGQVLWSVESGRMGNTMCLTKSLFTVVVKEVHIDKGYIVASWNGNPARPMYRVKNLRTTEPLMITSVIGSQRLATRAEIAAMKQKKAKKGEE